MGFGPLSELICFRNGGPPDPADKVFTPQKSADAPRIENPVKAKTMGRMQQKLAAAAATPEPAIKKEVFFDFSAAAELAWVGSTGLSPVRRAERRERLGGWFRALASQHCGPQPGTSGT